MKITLFLLLFVIFQVYSGNCYSQNARVSIQNARLRVGQVLEQIESQTEYLFVYNKQNVDVRRTVDINAQFKQKQWKVKMREMNCKWLKMSNIS